MNDYETYDGDIQKFSHHFNQKVDSIRAGPAQQRRIQDVCCLITFILILLLTFILGIYMIASGQQFISQLGSAIQNNSVTVGPLFAKTSGLIVGMVFLSISLSFIMIILCKLYPKCVVYSMIIITFVIYLVLLVLSIAFQIYGLTVVLIIMIAINVCFLCCYQRYIAIGIVLLKCASSFINEKPSVYLISIISSILNIIFLIFWCVSYLGGYSLQLQYPNSSSYNGIVDIWYVIGIFFGFFNYYGMVFIIAVATACWYYRQEGTSIFKGCQYIIYSVGSITFGAIVVTVIKILRMAAQRGSRNNNGVAGMIFCLVQCLLKCIEDIVKVLNHNAVIVMALTGQNYIDSAKTAMAIILNNFGLFIIVDFISDFLSFYLTVVCVIIPACIGGYITYTYNLYNSQNLIYSAFIVALIIFLLALFICQTILGMLYEALSCIFIFYCLDKRLRSAGVEINNVPPQIKDLFDGALGHRGGQQNTMNQMLPTKNQRRVQAPQNYNNQQMNNPNYNQGYPQVYNQGLPYQQPIYQNQQNQMPYSQPYNQPYNPQFPPINQNANQIYLNNQNQNQY